MDIRRPEDLTLDEIKEQLALYSRLYYQKRRNDKDYMERKRANAIKQHRKKKLEQNEEIGDINLKTIDYEEKNNEDNENTLRKTKPRKYKATTYKVIGEEWYRGAPPQGLGEHPPKVWGSTPPRSGGAPPQGLGDAPIYIIFSSAPRSGGAPTPKDWGTYPPRSGGHTPLILLYIPKIFPVKKYLKKYFL